MINADDMQSWAYLLAPTFQFVNTAGKPLTEGWIEVYIAGTRDKYYCASDFNGTLHPFQIPLDSLGANIVLADPDQAYDVYVYNKYGSLIMSRYHVSPGMAGGSGVLSITIGSEDGTVSVTNDGNGNFDLSIQDTVDRIDALEQAVSGLSTDSTVGYAIAHAYTVELDGTFDLISDAITGIGYTPNMDGFRLKSGHVYQFNFNALFENGEFDRNCSGKLYLEGPNTIAQEWKFTLDDTYYHSQSINGSTVLVTPKDLNYYDVKLKLAWDVDYPNKPNVDLNKISIVDITTILSTTVSGTGGNYTGGDGIFVNDETYVISVDMDYINSHLNIDATEIIASAVNIATAYTDARVTTVSGDLVNLIAEVSASIPTGSVTQVQSDWTEQDSSSPAYIQHKPDLTVYATNASLTAVSSVLQSEIEAISGAIPTDYVTHDEVSAVSGNIIEYVNSVSGDLVETINNVSGDIIHTVESVSGDIINTVTTVSGDIIETITTVSGDIIETVNNVSGDIIHTVESVSGDLIEIIETATANIPEQVNADWEAVSGKAEILNKPDLSVYATHTEVSGVSAVLNERINNVSGDLIETITTVSGDIINTVESVSAVLEGDIVSAIQVATGAIPEQVNSDWNAVSGKAEILNKPDLSIYATHDELVDAVTAVSSMIPTDYVTHNEVSAVSANLVNYVNSVSGDITNYVDESIVSAINVATGSFEQVQSDWTEDDTNDPSYIQNKPTEIEIVAGQNIGIFADASTITIAASATDLSNYSTHSEVATVSGTLNTAIANKKNKQSAYSSSGSNTKTITNISQNANGEISVTYSNISYPQQTPSVEIVSPSGTLNISSSTSGNTKTFSIDVAPTSGIEYGQFYATNITGAATMARTKGNIDITNDGKIKLKQGQSYHVTVRGRYNQTVLKDNYTYASYIEYVTNNSININVDESRSDSQYFELSYDLFKLNSDTNYYVFFSLDDATVNDLFIDIHSLANVGGNSSSGGSSPEYDAGYGIQILNNVISVSGIAPQVQSDWNQTNSSSVDYIKNKPEEYGLLAGDNISITASGNNFVISSTASASSGVTYQAGYGIDITDDTISVDASIIPEQQINSDWTATSGVAEILNKPNESELIAGAGVSITASGSNYIISAIVTGSPVLTGYVTETELQTVSGNIVNQIPDVSNLATKQEVATVSGMIPDISGLATNADLQIVSAAIPDVSNLATKTEVQSVETDVQIVSAAIPTLPTEEEVEFEEIDLSDYALASAIPVVTGFATEVELQIVSAAIPDVSNFVTGPTVSAIVEESLVDIPTGVSGVVAGDGISITASGSNYVISCSVTGTGDVTRADLASVSGILEGQIQTVSGSIPDTSNLATKTELATVSAAIPDISGLATEADLQIVSAAIPDTSNLATKTEVSNVEADVQIVSAAIPDTSDMATQTWVGNQGYLTSIPSTYVTDTELNGAVSGLATKTEVQTVSSAIPDISGLATKVEVATASGTLNNKIDTVSGNIPTLPDEEEVEFEEFDLSSIPTGVSGVVAGQGIAITASGSDYIISCTVTGGGAGDVTRAELISVSGNLETEIQVVSAAIPTLPSEEEVEFEEFDLSSVPTGVSGLVAGDNITITASGSNYIISGQAGGSTYSAGDYIGITNNTISVTGITDVVAGNCVSITSSGNSAVIDWTTTAGITDIQMVNSLPASPVSTVLYLIPEA